MYETEIKMNKLNKSDYGKILHLAKDAKHNRAIIFSIIDGNLDGQIYVDDPQHPAAAFIAWEFSFLLGEEKDEKYSEKLFRHIFESLVPISQDGEILLFADTAKWPHLTKLLKEKGCITITRKMFSFNAVKFHKLESSLPTLPKGFKIINEDLGADGFGCSVADGSHILSRCRSVAVGANQAETDIFTDEAHRNLGFATKAAAAFIGRCIEKGITPVWSCWPERRESVSLAKKLGFEETEEIPVVYWTQDM